MQEMVEPDRTILIVSIIGLVVIWGSVAYHRFVQGGRSAVAVDDETPMAAQAAPDDVEKSGDDTRTPATTGGQGRRGAVRPADRSGGGAGRRGKGRKGRRR